MSPETAVLSTDGALTTTLVGILAERELQPTPLEATAFALGIHEDTGSLTYATTTQRDVDALSWCLRHGARQDLVNEYLHTPLAARRADAAQARSWSGSSPSRRTAKRSSSRPCAWPEYVDGVSNLAHKIVDLTDARALVLLVEMDERVFVVVRSRTDAIDAAAVAGVFGGGGHAQAASAIARVDLDVGARARTSRRSRTTPEQRANSRATSCRRLRAQSGRTRPCATR